MKIDVFEKICLCHNPINNTVYEVLLFSAKLVKFLNCGQVLHIESWVLTAFLTQHINNQTIVEKNSLVSRLKFPRLQDYYLLSKLSLQKLC